MYAENHLLAPAMYIVAFISLAIIVMVPFVWSLSSLRERYVLIGGCQTALAAGAVWLLFLGSLGDIIAMTEEWFALGLFGWCIGAGIVFMAVSPLVTVVALVITRCQSVAKRKRGIPAD